MVKSKTYTAQLNFYDMDTKKWYNENMASQGFWDGSVDGGEDAGYRYGVIYFPGLSELVGKDILYCNLSITTNDSGWAQGNKTGYFYQSNYQHKINTSVTGPQHKGSTLMKTIPGIKYNATVAANNITEFNSYIKNGNDVFCIYDGSEDASWDTTNYFKMKKCTITVYYEGVSVYYGSGGQWKPCQCFVGSSGSWKPGDPMFGVNGKWE